MTAAAMSERELQAAVIQLARLCGWLVYHTHDSRHSAAGFPDLVMVRDGVLLIVELKSAIGKLAPAQSEWLALLEATGAATVAVWRPEDWMSGRIDVALRRPRPESRARTTK